MKPSTAKYVTDVMHIHSTQNNFDLQMIPHQPRRVSTPWLQQLECYSSLSAGHQRWWHDRGLFVDKASQPSLSTGKKTKPLLCQSPPVLCHHPSMPYALPPPQYASTNFLLRQSQVESTCALPTHQYALCHANSQEWLQLTGNNIAGS
jgi:hypothetical protein